jgi:drug/metabolite transporter (DMT)-like permease
VAAVLLALGTSVCWGISSFIAGRESRRRTVLAVTAVTMPAAAVYIGSIVAIRGIGPPGGNFWLEAFTAGVFSLIALTSLYRGLAIGTMGVVAPIATLAPVAPVIYGVARGERPSTLAIAGMPLALAGIVLGARQPGTGLRAARLATGAGLGLLAAAGIGCSMIALHAASQHDPYWTPVVQRGFTAAVIVTVVLARRPSLGGTRRALPLLVLAGVGDMTGTLFMTIAYTKGLLSVVAVLASLYPIVIALLARAVLSERLTRMQALGAGTALLGAALITAGR